MGQSSFPFPLSTVAGYTIFCFNIAKIKNPHARPPRTTVTNCPQEDLENPRLANDCDDAIDPKQQTQATSNPEDSHAPRGHPERPCSPAQHAAD